MRFGTTVLVGLAWLGLAITAFGQGEYADKGTSATMFGGGATLVRNSHAYGLFLGGVTGGRWDVNFHFALGKDDRIETQQIGAQLSAFVGRSRERVVPFFAFRLGFDYMGTNYNRNSIGYSAITPTISLIAVSNNISVFSWVPSISASIHKYMGDLAPATTGAFQASLGLRWKFHSGTVAFLEPGIGSANFNGHSSARYFVTGGILAVH